MKVGKRYEAIYLHRKKCSFLIEEVYVPVFFSFEVFEVEGDSVVVGSFLPPGIEGILRKREFFFIKEFIDEEHVVINRSRLEEIEDSGRFRIHLEEITVEERRLFDRFYFCPEMLGKWNINVHSEELGSYVVDVSLKGIRFLVPEEDTSSIPLTAPIVARKQGKVIEFQPCRVTSVPEGCLLAGNIRYTNFNLVRYVVDNYVKMVKGIIGQNT